MSKTKKYKLAGKEYHAREKYSFKTWGKILTLLKSTGISEDGDVLEGIIVLLEGDALIEMLNLILDQEVNGELYEEDIREVGVIVQDFLQEKTV